MNLSAWGKTKGVTSATSGTSSGSLVNKFVTHLVVAKSGSISLKYVSSLVTILIQMSFGHGPQWRQSLFQENKVRGSYTLWGIQNFP